MIHCPKCAKTNLTSKVGKKQQYLCESCGYLFDQEEALIRLGDAKTILARFNHPVRQAIMLSLMVNGEMSPKMISDAIDEGLSQTSYHVRVLKDCKAIAQTKTRPARGAVEHFYKARDLAD